MSAPRARRQHTAAKVYLRGFVDDTGQLCRHGRDGQVEIRNIRSASVERDFCTYQDAGGQPNERVEHWFATDIEDAAAAALRSLQRGNDLQPEWVGADEVRREQPAQDGPWRRGRRRRDWTGCS